MYVKRCVEQFEQTNKVKYLSDFKEFVFESSVEDFCDVSGADVVVSTIHKAKGREFDDVYMLISDNYSKDIHLMRRYYVGITRTKNQLFVHTNGDCFNHLSADRYLSTNDSMTCLKKLYCNFLTKMSIWDSSRTEARSLSIERRRFFDLQ